MTQPQPLLYLAVLVVVVQALVLVQEMQQALELLTRDMRVELEIPLHLLLLEHQVLVAAVLERQGPTLEAMQVLAVMVLRHLLREPL